MKYLFIVLLAVAVIFGYGFTRIAQIPGSIEKTEHSNVNVTGEMLYQKNCAACHGIDRQGIPPTFPALIDIDKKMDKGQVSNQLLTGKNTMPSFSHLSESERNAITGYLFGEQTEVDFVTEITPAENGKSLFVANCARCHQATPDDVQPPDQRNWGMQPAILGGIHERYEFDEFESIVNMGPCYMPSFDHLNSKDKDDIYAYLKTLENSYDGGNEYGRGRCQMNCRNWK
ncbi:MAG: c-type cytochrome [Bacteroidales bacterium]|jgi:mono/diheme cytochrome c family protein|nr:c-type cytochrome [Bacteroidota bacterium]MEE4260319.1 c-type cytochrome [Bacteroidales bacterium]